MVLEINHVYVPFVHIRLGFKWVYTFQFLLIPCLYKQSRFQFILGVYSMGLICMCFVISGLFFCALYFKFGILCWLCFGFLLVFCVFVLCSKFNNMTWCLTLFQCITPNCRERNLSTPPNSEYIRYVDDNVMPYFLHFSFLLLLCSSYMWGQRSKHSYLKNLWIYLHHFAKFYLSFILLTVDLYNFEQVSICGGCILVQH